MGHLAERECGVGLDEVDVRWRDVDVPFCEIGVHQHEQIDDVRETQRDTRKEDREEADSLLDVEVEVNAEVFDEIELESCDVEESPRAGKVDADDDSDSI